jgi:hypothetical protein
VLADESGRNEVMPVTNAVRLSDNFPDLPTALIADSVG